MDTNYLSLLREKYPTIQAASHAITSLQARLYLPKETEFFLSDLHGEHEAFVHLLNSASGVLQRTVDELLSDELSAHGRQVLCAVIAYPEQKLPDVLASESNGTEWIRITLYRLLRVCRAVSSKYPLAKVNASLPSESAEIIAELLHILPSDHDLRMYHKHIIETVIEVGQGPRLITDLAHLIQRFTLAHLHLIGDIYDRGPGAHIIMDSLQSFHSIDIQWGNHDIVWMGAAAGGGACIANVIRLSLRYANTETLENGYGISLLPLASFALDVYSDDPCSQFMPRDADDRVDPAIVDDAEQLLLARMQKAISIIQFKLEGQIIQRRPHYAMNDRLLLDKIDLDKGVVTISDRSYELLDSHFPTLDPNDPYRLSEREQQVIDRLTQSFQRSRRLQSHIRFLYANGGMYRVYNDHLLYHGCISLNDDGSFTELVIDGQVFSGRSFMDRVERLAREGYFATDSARREYGQDAMWYLWSGKDSPIFGKNKMATFERYFVRDKTTHKEAQNPYFRLRDDVSTVRRILAEFGLDPQTGRIVNGHVPVRVKEGQNPIMANGQLIVIDGGLAKAYQRVTGIAGYTLISNSNGLLLAEHHPFESVAAAIDENRARPSKTTSIATWPHRLLVKDTDEGAVIRSQIADLRGLLEAYRSGAIKEQITV